MNPENTDQSVGQSNVAPATPAVSATPETGGSFGPSTSAVVSTPVIGAVTSTKKPKKLIVFGSAIGMAVLLCGGGAAAYFGYMVPNKPENIWSAALKNTANGYDKLMMADSMTNDSGEVSGTFKVGAGVATDGTFSAKYTKNSAVITADAGVVTSRVDAEVRLVDVDSSEYPDVYLKVKGIKELGALVPGMGEFTTKYNDKWLSVDHTIFSNISSQAGVETSGMGQSLTKEEWTQVSRAVGEVNREYLFTEDTQKAVFKVVNGVGKESQDGRSVYHYTVGLDRQHTKDYVTTLAAKLDSTPAKKLVNGKTFSEAFNLESVKKSLDSYQESDTADVYVDIATKTVRTVRMADKDNSKNVLELGMPLTDADKVPLTMKLDTDDDGNTISFKVAATMDLKSGVADMTLDVSGKSQGDSQTTTANVKMQIKPLGGSLSVEKPADASSINELIGDLGVLGAFGGASGATDDLGCSTEVECMEQLKAMGVTGI